MKLHEIIDTQNLPTRKFKLGKLLGSGADAKVYDDLNDPHMALKMSTSRKSQKHDYYGQYIDVIVKNGLSGVNPFAPRVYNIGKSKFTNNKSYQIEKLTPLYSVSFDEMHHIMQDISGVEADEKFDSMDIIRYLNGAFMGKYKVHNKYLQEIVDIVTQLDGGIDICMDNVMVRRTPYGPQLVITDPII